MKESFEGTVTELDATYAFWIFSAPGPLETFEEVGVRELQKWSARLAVPSSVLDAVFEKNHMQRWYVQQHTGENQFGAKRRLPAFGPRGVKARFDRPPSGGLVRASGLGTYAIGADDIIRFLSIGGA